MSTQWQDTVFEGRIDFSDDLIDVQEIVDRVEYLIDERVSFEDAETEAREVLAEASDEYEDLRTRRDSLTDADVPESLDIIQAHQKAQEDHTAAWTALEAWKASPAPRELAMLEELLSEMKGSGGDVQYNGDWYPGVLIAEGYFTDYARQLLEDCGDVPRDIPWYVEIDWEETADNLKMDYSEVDVRGFTYLYRN